MLYLYSLVFFFLLFFSYFDRTGLYTDSCLHVGSMPRAESLIALLSSLIAVFM